MKYLDFNILLLILITFIPSKAQKDSTKVSFYDTLSFKEKFTPSAFRFGTDVIQAASTAIEGENKDLGFQADIDFHKYFLSVDFGFIDKTWDKYLGGTRKNNKYYHNYNLTGNYIRAGIDMNLLKPDPLNSVFFIGFRYGRSFYDDNIYYLDTMSLWDRPIVGANTNARASWFEFVTGLKVNIWKNLFLGYTASYKFGITTNGNKDLQSYYIPGYGKYDPRRQFGFNYYLSWRLQWRQKALPPDKKRKR